MKFLTDEFYGRFAHAATVFVRAPGRVNMLGEHIDYNNGPVLPAAIDREVNIAAAQNEEGIVQLYAVDLGEYISFSLDHLPEKTSLEGTPLPAWALYPAGVAWALQEAGLPTPGLKAIFSSTVPIGAGLSSSAAVEVGFGALWQAFGGWELDRLELARVCQRAENLFVGVSCGLMDQFACACGVTGSALLFDTRSLEWFPVPLPRGTAVVIADSGVRRTLTTSAYNDRRAACEEAVRLLQGYLPEIESLRDVTPQEFAAYKPFLPPLIQKRADHVVKEIARVESAVTALKRNDPQAFGALMFASHVSLRDMYEVSTPELDQLVAIARNQPGCWGARLTGAGFGGCTVNLIQSDQAEPFISGLRDSYYHHSGFQIQIYLCQASQGVTTNSLNQ